MIRYLCLLLILLVHGCATPLPEGDTTWRWQLNGRAVFQGPEQRESVSILWQSGSERDLIHLSGPLGQGAVRLIADQRGATLWQDGEIRASNHSIEALLYEQLHWQVPVSSLKYWVRGKAAPSNDTTPAMTEKANSRHFTQDGWSISIIKLNAQGLPGKVVLERTPFKLTLLISTWKP